MNTIKICITNAFCKDGAGGNKAGVVFDCPGLNRKQKMLISKKLGYSETAFVTSSESADYKLEYFTPTEEVPLCGHATIAAFSTLYHRGIITAGTYTIETKAGILQVTAESDGLIMMQQNQPQYYEEIEKKELLPALGDGISEKQKSQIISTGLRDVIVPFSGVKALFDMRPDFDQISEISKRYGTIGIHAFAVPEKNTGVDAFCRNFAPLYGINEESATGTSSCALAGFLYKNGFRKEHYLFEQGYSPGLPSQIFVNVTEKEGEIREIYAGGYGVEERN